MTRACGPLAALSDEPFVAAIPGDRAQIIAAQRFGAHIRSALHGRDTDDLAACLNRFAGISVDKSADGYRAIRAKRSVITRRQRSAVRFCSTAPLDAQGAASRPVTDVLSGPQPAGL
jgi:hypothetical protein